MVHRAVRGHSSPGFSKPIISSFLQGAVCFPIRELLKQKMNSSKRSNNNRNKTVEPDESTKRKSLTMNALQNLKTGTIWNLKR